MRFILFLLFGLSLNVHALADTCSIQQENVLKKFSEKTLEHKDSSGYITAIALVSQRGTAEPISIYAGVNGIKDNHPINQYSLVQIGSVTKSFITVVILQLAQEKHFSLDDPNLITKYFPEYPKWAGITLRQLLNMTSGIPGNGNSHTNDIFMKFTEKEYASYISPIKILDLTYAYPLDFPPGTSWEYSNTNYTLLGQFIQRVTHKSPESEVTTRIIEKLGLKHTYFPINTIKEIPNIPSDEIVHGYDFTTKSYHPYAFMPFGQDVTNFSLSEYNTAGAMISTPADINTYLHALYNPGPLLNPAQIAQLTTLVSRVNGSRFDPKNNLGNPLGFGLGIAGYYWPSKQRTIYLYNGVTSGFVFYYLYDPQTQQYFSYVVNSLADKDDAIVFKKLLNLFDRLIECN